MQDSTKTPTKVIAAGWGLMAAGLAFPPLIAVGAWTAIAGMVWGAGAMLKDKGYNDACRERDALERNAKIDQDPIERDRMERQRQAAAHQEAARRQLEADLAWSRERNKDGIRGDS